MLGVVSAIKYTNKIIFNLFSSALDIIKRAGFDKIIIDFKIRVILKKQGLIDYFSKENKTRHARMKNELNQALQKEENFAELELSENIYYKDAKQAYIEYIRNTNNNYSINDIQIPADKNEKLYSWHEDYSENELATWSLAKEFALTKINNETDNFLDGMPADKKMVLENNENFLCSISKTIMRDPVYLVSTNGIKHYYDRLNLEKAISTRLHNHQTPINPITNEEISSPAQIIPDHDLQYEIEAAVKFSIVRFIMKYSYKLVDLLFIQYEPDILSMFLGNEKFTHDQELVDSIDDPDIRVHIEKTPVLFNRPSPLTPQSFYQKHQDLHSNIVLVFSNNREVASTRDRTQETHTNRPTRSHSPIGGLD